MAAHTELGVRVGEAAEDWSGDARYFEYSRAANPIGSGNTPKIPIKSFPPSLHEAGGTRIVPLDLAGPLKVSGGPATSPALLASFVRILPGEGITTESAATSDLFYVLRGSGVTESTAGRLSWAPGDLFVLPGGGSVRHEAVDDT